jgi:hypothetical protein
MAYDRSLLRIGEKDYHNKFAETKETSPFCVTPSRNPACRCRTMDRAIQDPAPYAQAESSESLVE